MDNTWETLNSPTNHGLNARACYDLDGNLHIVGGFSANTKHSIYNLKDKTWNNKADYPTPIVSGAINCAPNGKLYYFGGANPTNNVPTDLVYYYDNNNNNWTKITNLPDKRCHFAYVNTNDQFVIMGGAADSWAKDGLFGFFRLTAILN